MSSNADTILKIVDVVFLLGGAGVNGKIEYDKLRSKLQEFELQNRNPTSAEWQELDSQCDSVHKLIQGL